MYVCLAVFKVLRQMFRIRKLICIYVRILIRMYVCMHACVLVCMYVCTYVCMSYSIQDIQPDVEDQKTHLHLCTNSDLEQMLRYLALPCTPGQSLFMYVYVCMYVCMGACQDVAIFWWTHVHWDRACACIYVCMYVCMTGPEPVYVCLLEHM